MSCANYEGPYVLISPIPPNKQLQVVCSTEGVELRVDEDTYEGVINTVGQLEVTALGLVASVTGTEPNRYLFGVANFAGGSGSKLEEGGANQPEPWGAEEGMIG